MFNDLRGGINTRLYSKNKYDSKKHTFLNNRSKEDQNMMKVDNNGQFTNYELFNKEFNKKYKKMEDEFNKFNNTTNQPIEKKNEFKNVSFDSTPIIRNNNIIKKNKTFSRQSTIEKTLTNKIYKDDVKNENNSDLEKKYNTLLDQYNNHHKSDENIDRDTNNNNKLKNLEIKYTTLLEKYNVVKKREKEVIEDQQKKMILMEKHQKELSYNKIQQMAIKQNRFLQTIKKVLIKNIPEIKEDLIQKHINENNLLCNNCSPQLLTQLVNKIIEDYNANFKQQTSKLPMLDKIVKPTKDFNVSINSTNRDIDKWPKTNEFQIQFVSNIDNYTKNGYIESDMEDILQIQLVSAIFPKKCPNGDILENYPYIILEIDELKRGQGMLNDKTFAHITFDIDIGKYKKAVPRYSDEYLIKFNTPISFNSLSFKIKNSKGELYNFGENISKDELSNETNKYVPEVTFIFKVIKNFNNLNKNMTI